MMGAEGIGFTFTETGSELGDSQPFISVIVRLKVPDVPTLIEEEVAAFDQEYDWPPAAESVTSLPSQNVSAPELEITGAAGN